jgi:hypothetical protein
MKGVPLVRTIAWVPLRRDLKSLDNPLSELKDGERVGRVGKYQLLVNDCAPRTERMNGSSVRRRRTVFHFHRTNWAYVGWSRDCCSSASTVAHYRLDDRAVEVRSPAEAKDLSFSFLSNGYRGPFALGVKRDRGVMLTSHFHIVARSRMSRSCISCRLQVSSLLLLPPDERITAQCQTQQACFRSNWVYCT